MVTPDKTVSWIPATRSVLPRPFTSVGTALDKVVTRQIDDASSLARYLNIQIISNDTRYSLTSFLDAGLLLEMNISASSFY